MIKFFHELQKFGRGWIDLLLPEICSYCEEHPVKGAFPRGICSFCFPKCSLRPEEFSIDTLEDPSRMSTVCYPLYVCAYYERLIPQAVRSLKFHSRQDFAKSLGGFLVLYWNRTMRKYFIDDLGLQVKEICLIPMPLHKKRLRNRRYNQVELIAKEFCKWTEITLVTDCLYRSKETHRQSECTSRKERLGNVQDAFELRNSEKIQGKHVILLDDVLSSGATMWSAASCIRKSTERVICLALASEREIAYGGKV